MGQDKRNYSVPRPGPRAVTGQNGRGRGRAWEKWSGVADCLVCIHRQPERLLETHKLGNTSTSICKSSWLSTEKGNIINCNWVMESGEELVVKDYTEFSW